MEAINQTEKQAKRQRANSEWRRLGVKYSKFALEALASGALVALSGIITTRVFAALGNSRGEIVPIRKAQ